MGEPLHYAGFQARFAQQPLERGPLLGQLAAAAGRCT
jgi:hypothetical protein